MTDATRVLVLQGGGALGSYQAGVYEALEEADYRPDWIAGTSVGAINAALIAGNAPDQRMARLSEFWHEVSSGLPAAPAARGDAQRTLFNQLSAFWIATLGAPGMFRPRPFPAALYPAGAPEAISHYDTVALRRSLERLVDFDRINARETRLSVGAVNIRTGNFVNFDNRQDRIGPEHIMASGALPPGFPAVEIDGEHYWDGGLVSNSPLEYVMDQEQAASLEIMQVDLFAARGPLPRTLMEVAEREKDIRYSSRTRLNTEASMAKHKAKAALRQLLGKLPDSLAEDPEVALLRAMAQETNVTIAQLIYRRSSHEGTFKDFEFSRPTMEEHWRAGRGDARRTLRHKDWIGRTPAVDGVAVFDLSRDARD